MNTDTPALEPVCADPQPMTAEEAIAALQASERARMRERDAGALEVEKLKARLEAVTAERDDLRERLAEILTP